METWLLWRQSIMAVFQITCEKLLGGEKEEWIFIKDHSSTYSYIQIFNLCKKINGSKRETVMISALDQQQVSVGKDVKSWFFRICLDMKSWFSRAQEATLKKEREREKASVCCFEWALIPEMFLLWFLCLIGLNFERFSQSLMIIKLFCAKYRMFLTFPISCWDIC